MPNRKTLNSSVTEPSLSKPLQPSERVREPLMESLQFQFPLRKYQRQILDLVHKKLDADERRMHLVAPPGAGKTIIGLQIASELKCPTLILSPNTTIQSQWGQKIDLFLPPNDAQFGTADIIGTHEDKPLKPITLLTYQVLSTPGREQEYLEKMAHTAWVEELRSGRQISYGEAEVRILDLMRNNPKVHQKEISRHVSRLRRKLTDVLDLNEVLHANALKLLQALRRQKFGLVIFDECHHLTDYWAAIMTHLVAELGDPVIVGLTGTPPEGKSATQETRYLSLVGEIDYQVPTPALVKEGGLAPFQDLVFYTEPTERELKFLEEQHEEFHVLIDELMQPVYGDSDSIGGGTASNAPLPASLSSRVSEVPNGSAKLNRDVTISGGSSQKLQYPPLTRWVQERVFGAVQKDVVRFTRIADHQANVERTKAGKKKKAETAKADSSKLESKPIVPPGGWTELIHAQPDTAQAFCRYLWKARIRLPRNIDPSDALLQTPTIDDLMRVLDDFASHELKISSNPDDHKLYDRIRAAARKLGYGISEQGLRKQASPVDRVLAFSNSKPNAVSYILEIEHRVLQERLRAVVVTDFETMSATAVKTLKGVLDQESGGALACIKTLLNTSISEFVNPCLVTGSLLLVDKRITERFVRAAKDYLTAEGHTFDLIVNETEDMPFDRITANSGEWQSKLYVGMATAIFERGITKCLIGTRGLFGEGWDSQALNTLIDLTTTTSPVSVKQLRGRSIRIQTNDPLGARKVANNWDVVCIAPQLEKGLNDYHRFVKKHECFFGISEDGLIERGVGHVHPAFSELTPIEVFACFERFNDVMIQRSLQRERIYDLWRVGQPYKNRMLGCVELSNLRKLALTPPHIRCDMKYKEHARQMRAELGGIWGEYAVLGAAAGGLAAFVSSSLLGIGSVLLAAAMMIGMMYLAWKKSGILSLKLRKKICKPNTQDSSLYDVGTAVLTALQRRKFIPANVTREQIRITSRADGTYRVFLDDLEPEQAEIFIESFKEAMAPVTNQPFLIPKYEYFVGGPEELRIDDDAKDAPGNVEVLNEAPTDSLSVPVPSLASEAQAGGNGKPQLPLISKDNLETVAIDAEFEKRETLFFKKYLNGRAQPRVAAYHPVPSLLARSEKGREAYEAAWNKYVSPGFIESTESKPELLDRYFALGPTLAQRVVWE